MKLKVSLRSRKTINGEDAGEGVCEKIAAHFKGGGHPNAASFFTSNEQLQSYLIFN
jgi:oligoribonuclease NrnB/cAMP/cGMP phosphodiesterase (DHH superfamily)